MFNQADWAQGSPTRPIVKSENPLTRADCRSNGQSSSALWLVFLPPVPSLTAPLTATIAPLDQVLIVPLKQTTVRGKIKTLYINFALPKIILLLKCVNWSSKKPVGVFLLEYKIEIDRDIVLKSLYQESLFISQSWSFVLHLID